MSGPESESLLPGSKFGVYEIGECIGRGAMGQVYRAEHTLMKRAVALKLMTTAARNSTTGHRRFKREARAAAAIKHPNVVEILDMGVLDGLPFIVMELLEGEDLESYLARHGKLSEQQLADLALPITAAIGAVHDAGVVHRDIKPSNIFLAKGGREETLVPKVLDFGISKAAKSLGDTEFVATGPGDLVGTPLYISPEALKGAQYLTAKSDQYSLGVVLYQCAVGRRPHEAKELARLVRAILSDPIEPLRSLDPSLSPELESAVMRALSRNPDERFGHVRDLGAGLWSLASQRTRHIWAKRFSTSLAYTLPLGLPAAPEPPPAPPRDWRPLGAGVAAAAAVLATGYLVSVTWPQKRVAHPAPAGAEAAQQAQAAILAQQVAPLSIEGAGAPSGSGASSAAPVAAEATPSSQPVAAQPLSTQPLSTQPLSTQPQAAQPAAAPEPPTSAPSIAPLGASSGEAGGVLPRATVSVLEATPARAAPEVGVGAAAVRPLAIEPAPQRSVAPRPAPRKPVAARAVSRPERVLLDRRAPSPRQDEAALLRRARERQPADIERSEAPPLPRGANQSPILD